MSETRKKTNIPRQVPVIFEHTSPGSQENSEQTTVRVN